MSKTNARYRGITYSIRLSSEYFLEIRKQTLNENQTLIVHSDFVTQNTRIIKMVRLRFVFA